MRHAWVGLGAAMVADDDIDSAVVLADGAGEWMDLIDRLRPAWSKRAACRDAPSGISWFPGPVGNEGATAAAKAVCATCPVLGKCRSWALQQGNGLYGIWGGLTEAERRQLRDRPQAERRRLS